MFVLLKQFGMIPLLNNMLCGLVLLFAKVLASSAAAAVAVLLAVVGGLHPGASHL